MRGQWPRVTGTPRVVQTTCWGGERCTRPGDALCMSYPRTSACLRACLKRSRSGCETPHHQVDHGDSDPRLRGLRQGLKVFTEPPRAIEPAEGAFHDPAPLHDLKALGMPRAFHNDEGPEHLFGPITILDPGSMHDDDEEQPEDIDDDVALAPADTLAAVIAADPPFSVVLTV